MRALLVHPGTQHSFTIAAQLHRRGCLGRFCTGVAIIPTSLAAHLHKYLPKHLQHGLGNRLIEGVPKEKLWTRPFTELKAQGRLRAGCDSQLVMFERNREFQRAVPARDLANSEVVIGFDTSSWLLSDRASIAGRPFVLDQSTVHSNCWQRISQSLRSQFPDWAEDFPPRLPQLSQATQTEHRKADKIVVASTFARRTLIENGVEETKTVVNPYGVDLRAFLPVARPDSSRPLRFVFVGGLLGRKGVPLLLNVWRSLNTKNAELWLVGDCTARNAQQIGQVAGLRLLGKVSHSVLPMILSQCDVFVFPSYLEGFGLVLLEALAAGMPIIATDTTAAPDLLTNAKEGFIIPAGDAAALRDAMQFFINDPAQIGPMSLAARCCAKRFTCDAYGDRWVKILQRVI